VEGCCIPQSRRIRWHGANMGKIKSQNELHNVITSCMSSTSMLMCNLSNCTCSPQQHMCACCAPTPN
jgi:hypothetical protein